MIHKECRRVCCITHPGVNIWARKNKKQVCMMIKVGMSSLLQYTTHKAEDSMSENINIFTINTGRRYCIAKDVCEHQRKICSRLYILTLPSGIIKIVHFQINISVFSSKVCIRYSRESSEVCIRYFL